MNIPVLPSPNVRRNDDEIVPASIAQDDRPLIDFQIIEALASVGDIRVGILADRAARGAG